MFSMKSSIHAAPFVSTFAVSARAVSARAVLASAALATAALPVLCSSAQAQVYPQGSAVTVTPGGTTTARGLRVAVVSATDTAGNTLTAQRALVAAEMAIARTRGFVAVPRSEVSRAMIKNGGPGKGNTFDGRGPMDPRAPIDQAVPFGEPAPGDTRIPIDTLDYKAVGKSLKAPRALSVFVTRGLSDANGATVSAVAELYDTTSGGLVGRGESTFTATAAAPAADAGTAAAARRAATINADTSVVGGVPQLTATNEEMARVRALSGAVFRAVAELNRPIELRGVVVSIPGAYQTRISMGAQKGLRNGARVEYLVNGQSVAYGTVTSLGYGESLATVASEAAFSGIYVNMEVRNVSNPVLSRAGQSQEQLDSREFSRFERDFAIGLVGIGLLYYYTDAFDVFGNR